MKKLNGYRVSHRNKWLFIQHGILSVQELALLEFYADILDFDKNHQKYGTFEVDLSELQSIFRCKSQNTIRNWHNKLLKLGFIKRTDKRGFFESSCFQRYIPPGYWSGKSAEYAAQEKDQPIGIILQNFGIELQKIGELLQPVAKNGDELALKSNAKALGSSKDESKVYQEEKTSNEQRVKSDEEYQKIYKENNFEGLTPEDMKWIDENVGE